MIQFREISLSFKNEIKRLLSLSDFRGCEYTFGSNYIWRNYYDIKIAFFKNFYLIRNVRGYLFPAGKGTDEELTQAIELMREDAEKRGAKFIFSSMDVSGRDRLERIFGDKIEFSSCRDWFDYVYRRDDLAQLRGKKYHSKRNHLKYFYNIGFTYERITPENINECFEINRQWLEEKTKSEDEKGEISAIEDGLKNFQELEFIGGIIRVDGKAVAYTFGEKQNSDTFTVHAEKALELRGAYPAINYEFVNRELSSFDFINREEDTGAENLRRAKLSYHPAYLIEKFSAEFVT